MRRTTWSVPRFFRPKCGTGSAAYTHAARLLGRCPSAAAPERRLQRGIDMESEAAARVPGEAHIQPWLDRFARKREDDDSERCKQREGDVLQ